jgi:hypothetical protein
VRESGERSDEENGRWSGANRSDSKAKQHKGSCEKRVSSSSVPLGLVLGLGTPGNQVGNLVGNECWEGRLWARGARASVE